MTETQKAYAEFRRRTSLLKQEMKSLEDQADKTCDPTLKAMMGITVEIIKGLGSYANDRLLEQDS